MKVLEISRVIFLPFIVVLKGESVDEAESGVQHTEYDHLLIHQLINAASPVEDQTRKRAQSRVRHLPRVGDRHGDSVVKRLGYI